MFKKNFRPEPEPIDNTQTPIGGVINPQMIKHDISQVIKSVSITCDQEFVIFGAMRKILFKRVQEILEKKR